MGGTPNYKRFKQFETRIKAKEHAEKIKIKCSMFPHCRGTFDNCPTEDELNSMMKEKKAPRICGQCPAFQERPPKGITVDNRPRMSAEDLEFYNKMRERKNGNNNVQKN
jgi:hypothetical protein